MAISDLHLASALCSLLALSIGCGDDSSGSADDTGTSSSGADSLDSAPVTMTDPDTGVVDSSGVDTNTDTGTGSVDSSGGGSTDDTTDGGSEDTTGGQMAEPHVAGGSLGGLTGYENTIATGFALIVRRGDGTDISVQVSGLDADTAYPAHVHVQACDNDAAGGHYKIDPRETETVEANELWPAFTTDANGVGRIEISTDHLARADAMAVVVHDPANANAKMLCADLVTTDDADPFTTVGPEIVLQGGIDAGFAAMTAAGTMERSVDGGTVVTLDVTGLGNDQTYPVHVHERDCASADSGGHYKFDYSIATTEEDNELWLPVTTVGDGSGTGTISSAHLARAEAQALVIHNNDGSGARLACIDLDVSP